MNPLDRFRLDDKVVLVTGASSGLGVGFAHALAAAGATLVLAARREEQLQAVAEDVRAHGTTVLTVRTDRGDFVLDNLKDEVKDWKETEYRYLKRQSEKNSAKWVSIADDRDMLVGSVK